MDQFKKIWQRYRLPMMLVGGILLGLLVFCIMFLSQKKEAGDSLDKVLAENRSSASKVEESSEEEQTLASDATSSIQVDVKGAVKAPGLYELEEGSRVQDAIQKAGGVTDQADPKSINLAQKLADEGIVYVATKEEQVSALPAPATTSGGGKTEQGTGKININTATAEELQQLPGVGQKKAADILSYREENGPFKTIEDLTKISGIGEKTLEKWKDAITVGS